MNILKNKLTIALSAVGLQWSLQSTQAADVIYDGPDNGDWNTATNWNTDLYPSTSDNARLGTGTDNLTANISTTSPNNILAIRLGVDSGSSGTLNVNAGGVMEATSSSNWDSHIGSSGTGTVNVNGGDINLNFAEVGRNSSSLGTINLNSGIFEIARGSRENNDQWSIHLGSNDNDTSGGTGIINIYGGTFDTRFGIELGNQDNPSSAGTGSFNVYGSTATIEIGNDNNGDGNWFQGAGYTLFAGIDGGGISKIFLEESGNNGGVDVTFAAGSLLDLDFFGTSPQAGTWTLLEAEDTDIVDNGLALAAGVDSGWSFDIDNSGPNALLTVTYTIPEPSSAALLGISGLALLLRRRK